MKNYKDIKVYVLRMSAALITAAAASSFCVQGAFASALDSDTATMSQAREKSSAEDASDDASDGFSFDAETGVLRIKDDSGMEALAAGVLRDDFMKIRRIETGEDITSMDSPIFAGIPNLEELDLNKVESVTGFAFTLCENLREIKAPELREVGRHAFSNNNALVSVYMPKLETVGSSAFYNCTELRRVNLPAAQDIGSSAFSSCTKLREADLPSADHIGSKAFEKDTALSLVLPAEAPDTDSDDAIKDVKEFCVPEGASGYDEAPFTSYKDRISFTVDDFRIPENVRPKPGAAAVKQYDIEPSTHEKYIVKLEWEPSDDTFKEDMEYKARIRIEDAGEDHFTLLGFDPQSLISDDIRSAGFNNDDSIMTVVFAPLHSDSDNAGDDDSDENQKDPGDTDDGSDYPDDGSGDSDGDEGYADDDSGDSDDSDDSADDSADSEGTDKDAEEAANPDSKKHKKHKNLPTAEEAVRGTWTHEEDGWHFTAGGREYKNEWAYIYNPYAKPGDNSAAWFRFDENGVMLTGTYTDEEGYVYHLSTESDGSLGELISEIAPA